MWEKGTYTGKDQPMWEKGTLYRSRPTDVVEKNSIPVKTNRYTGAFH